MKKFYCLILLLSLVGCSKELVIDKSCNSPANCIAPIVNYINNHIEGVNQLNTDEHCRYNPKDSTLIIYIGKSESDYFKKWIIPLDGVDINLITMNSVKYSGHPFTATSINGECIFEFYESNNFKKNTCQWNYYPGATNGSKRRFREQFVLTFRRAVELSQRAP